MSISRVLVSICLNASQDRKGVKKSCWLETQDSSNQKPCWDRRVKHMIGNSSWTLACRKTIQLTLPGGLPALAMKNGFPDLK